MSINNKTRIFTRFVAGPLAAASILGGVALGFAAGANADPGPSDHPGGGYSAGYSHESRDSHRDFRPDFWDFWMWHHHRDHSYGWHRDS